MAFGLGSIAVALKLDTAEFNKALQGAAGNAKSMLGNLAKIGVAAAIGGAVVGIVGLAAALKQGSEAAAQAEVAMASLKATLEATGATDVEGIAAGVDVLANNLERLTGVDDAAIVEAAQQLAQFGVAGKSLNDAIPVVVNFARAYGVDMATAAKAFGQSLEGNTALLGRYLPAVRNLTEEQLRMGGAFELAGDKVKGQAQAFGETFIGRLERLKAAWEDLTKVFGSALNDALGPVFTEIQEAVNLFTDRLLASKGAMEGVKSAAQGFAQLIPQAINAVLGMAGQLVVKFAEFRVALAQLPALFYSLQESAAQFSAVALEGVAKLLQGFEQLPFVDAKLDESAEAARNFAVQLRVAAVNAGISAREAQKNADAMLPTVARAKEFANGLQNAVSKGASIKDVVNQIADRMGLAKEETQGLRDAMDALDGSTRAVVEGSSKVPPYAEAAAQAIQEAEQNAAGLQQNLNGAAQAARNVASAASDAGAAMSGGGGGGGGGGADPFGRRSGGSYSLNTGTAFGTAAELERAEAALRRMTPNAYAGSSGINAQRKFVEGLRATLQSQIAEQQAEFTQAILSELNSRGVFDAAERNMILAERMAEATRLGIIPRAGASIGGAAGLSIAPRGGNGTGGTRTPPVIQTFF